MLRLLSRVIFFTGLFFLPLISFPTIENGFEGPKIIFFQRWVEILWVLTVVYWLLKSIRFQFKNNSLILLIVSYFIWNFFTSLIGVNPNNSLYGLFWRGQGLIMLAHYFAFVFLIPVLLKKSDTFKVALVILASGITASLYVLFALIMKRLYDWPIYLYLGRPVGTFGNPDFLAGFLALTLPLIFILKGNILKFISAMIIIWGLIQAQSLGAVMALLMVTVFIFLAKIWQKHKKIAFFAGLLFIGVFLWQFINWLPVRLNSPTWAASRQRIWARAALAIVQRPLTGWGLENYQLAVQNINYPIKPGVNGEVSVDKAHNEILEILISAGLIGLIFWLGIIFLAGKNLLLQKNSILFVCLLVFLLKSQTNIVSTPEYFFFWLLVGLSLLTGRSRHSSFSGVRLR